MITIWPSILAADCLNINQELKTLTKSGIERIHLDIMDNHYVPNLSFGPDLCEAIHQTFPQIEIDVHLMTDDPQHLISRFAAAGASRISIHKDACIHLHQTLASIKNLGLKAGLAINPAEDLPELQWCESVLDYVLLMSVNPGFGGQKFIPSSLEQIRRIHQQYQHLPIMVDGGVDLSNLQALKKQGASDVVIGSALFKAQDYPANIRQFQHLAV